MGQNKVRTYLLYAIGEIALVMIGILLALQVNNWNEERKERNIEQYILQQVKEDLSGGLTDLEFNMSMIDQSMQSAQILIEHMGSQKPYDDSIGTHISKIFVWSVWLINAGGYESMKSEGINIISDEELRNDIINLYEGRLDFHREFESFINARTETLINQNGSFFFKSMNKGIGFNNGSFSFGYSKPLDYEVLRTDSDFRFQVETVASMLKLFQQLSNQGNKRRIESLIVEIDANLESF
ncbi:MAG: hypothetical protein JJ971_03075 [Balneolaceae bacterium]|nr:hypothetical protein [Balneolaceae bacterium]MBO6545354.1 hypothetical protein [Balneolaceae bacterium]MBO6646750.1 hypothetical protein [Balneolaceae bacterium]